MSIEAIIEKILLARQDLTREEILKTTEEKKKKAKGFLTDEAAVRIVASELGVKILRESFRHEVLIKNLISGLNAVTVVGRVTRIYPIQTFVRSDMTEGKIAHLLISDKTGELKVVLWDDKASILEKEKVEEGQIVRVMHGYTREGRNGKIELHLAERGNLQVLPPEDERVKIIEIKTEEFPITVEGTIATAPDRREVTVKTEKIAVTSFDLSDETGKIRVSLWRNLANTAKDFRVGTKIRIRNAYVRKGFGDQLELTSRSATSIEVLSKSETVKSELLSSDTSHNAPLTSR
jgi:replication factor A1